MFIGEYVHTVDAKKRLAVPARLRRELGEKAVVTRGQDGCLYVYPMAGWERLVEKLEKLSLGRADARTFVRFTVAQAQEVEPDALGRILIPDTLKAYAGLGKRVVVAGVLDRIELWDEARWEQAKQLAARNADAIAEKLGESGVL